MWHLVTSRLFVLDTVPCSISLLRSNDLVACQSRGRLDQMSEREEFTRALRSKGKADTSSESDGTVPSIPKRWPIMKPFLGQPSFTDRVSHRIDTQYGIRITLRRPK